MLVATASTVTCIAPTPASKKSFQSNHDASDYLPSLETPGSIPKTSERQVCRLVSGNPGSEATNRAACRLSQARLVLPYSSTAVAGLVSEVLIYSHTHKTPSRDSGGKPRAGRVRMLWSYLRSLLPSRRTQARPRVQRGTTNPLGTTARGPEARPGPRSLLVATSTRASGSAGAGQSVSLQGCCITRRCRRQPQFPACQPVLHLSRWEGPRSDQEQEKPRMGSAVKEGGCLEAPISFPRRPPASTRGFCCSKAQVSVATSSRVGANACSRG